MTRPVRVLHVDDEPGFADLTATFLERENERFEVVTETDVAAGLETYREREIDCIVSDHDMPGRNGIEFLREIRRDDPELPFVLFTGKGSEEVASEAVSAGVTDYLQKGRGTDQYTLLANRIENAVERFRSQRAVERQKRRLETLVSNLPGIVYRCRNEPEWPMEYVEGECERLTGFSAEELETGSIAWGADVVHPDDQGRVWSHVQHALEAGEPFECTYRILTADGEEKVVWERGRGVGAGSENDALEGFITDVTETRERDRRFEAILENAFQFTGLLDPDGTVREANEAALSIAGVDREAVVGDPLWEGPWFRENDRARELAREAVETAREGEPFREELELRTADGETVIVDFSVRPVRNAEGKVTLLVPEGRDITELRDRERRLHRNERRFQAVFDDPNLLVGLLETDGTTRDVNRTAIEYVEAERSDVVGEPFPETPWWSEDLRDDVERWIEEAADGEYVEYEATHRAGDDAAVAVEGRFRPVFDREGEVATIVVSAKDVTERERRERELKRRNERFDQFASFVSHDLQSPISAVRGRLELALETGEIEHVERAADAMERVDELRTDLVDTLRTGEIVSEVETVDLEAAMADVRTAVDPPETAAFSVAAGTTIDADPDALQRLLENLVGNSIEHGGDDVDVRIGRMEGGIYYEDDGPGIAPEHRDRVFTPGFSTKRGEAGIGMGMASVRQIVLAHDWRIDIDDARTLSGVRFEIRTE